MRIEVTPKEAARFLARGRMVWDGCDGWAGGIQLDASHRWRKSRKLRALTRKLAGPWKVDGWWITRKA